MSPICSHTSHIKKVKPHTNGCEECLKMGHTSKHPIMQSIEPGEDWMWCFVDEVVLEP